MDFLETKRRKASDKKFKRIVKIRKASYKHYKKPNPNRKSTREYRRTGNGFINIARKGKSHKIGGALLKCREELRNIHFMRNLSGYVGSSWSAAFYVSNQIPSEVKTEPQLRMG